MAAAVMSRSARSNGVILRVPKGWAAASLGAAALLVSACASNEPLAYDPATAEPPARAAPRAQAPQAEAEYVDERPAFFLEWKGGDLPGLTQRPSVDRTSPLPEYPASSKRNQEQGTTVLNACVTADGRLVDVHLAQSSGYPKLDEATVTWAKKAKYKPAMFGDEALAVCNFRLEWVWTFKNSR